MLGPVVQEVAALAERLEIAMPRTAMRRIVVEMGRCQHNLGRPGRRVRGQGGRGDFAALAIAPDTAVLVPPTAVAEMVDSPAVWPAARLAAAAGAHEADPVADLRPVDRIEEPQLRSYRHRSVPS